MDLEDSRINVKFRLSALWVCTMIFYIYNDYFSLLAPGSLRSILDGKSMLAGAEWKLVAAAASITIPNLMVVLSLVLRARANRWTNIIVGALYSAIIVATISPADSHAFYRFLGVIEIGMTLLVAWTAWKWPGARLSGGGEIA